jgi:C4-dicarboxylate transporter DctQ subunit
MKALTKLLSIFDRTLDVMAALAGFLLLFIMISVSGEVAARYFFNRPTGWVTEIGSYVLLYVTFLVAAWVLRGEGHVSMDSLINLFGPRTQSLIQLVTSAASALVCLLLAWLGARVSWDLFQTGYFTPTMLELPKWFLTAIISVGFLLLFVQFVRRVHAYLQKWRAT